jgi:hypothetical protein
MSAMKDQDGKVKESQDRCHDPVKQFNEDMILNKESELNLISAKDARETNLMATREEGKSARTCGTYYQSC